MNTTEISNVAEQLAKLDQLRSTGVINDAEFGILKARLIAGPSESLLAGNGLPEVHEVQHAQLPDSEPIAPSFTEKLQKFRRRVELIVGIFAAMGAIGLYLYPLVMEGVSSPCAAVEVKSYHGLLGSDGANMQALVKGYYKDLPPALACTLIYYGELDAPGF